MIDSIGRSTSVGAIESFRTGHGAPLAYVPGMLGVSADQPFLNVLGQFADVGSFNLPNFHGSQSMAMRSIHEWVFALSAVIDELDLAGGPCVASSVGAMLVLELMALRPAVFSELLLITPLGLWDDTHPIADVWSERTPRQRERLLARPDRATSFFDDPETLDVAERMDREIRRYRTRTASASLMWPIPEFGLGDRLHRVACPVSVVWGADDSLVPPSYRELWRHSLAQHRETVVVPDAGHLVEWDQPEAVAAVAAELLL